jgi:toxin HigB-1
MRLRAKAAGFRSRPRPFLLEILVFIAIHYKVIRSFRDREAEKLFHDHFSKRHRNIERPAQRKLMQLDQAQTLEDLARIPGNRLEVLRGDRKGQHSIRINDQYRVCFRWTEPDAFEVEIVDYH